MVSTGCGLLGEVHMVNGIYRLWSTWGCTHGKGFLLVGVYLGTILFCLFVFLFLCVLEVAIMMMMILIRQTCTLY